MRSDRPCPRLLASYIAASALKAGRVVCAAIDAEPRLPRRETARFVRVPYVLIGGNFPIALDFLTPAAAAGHQATVRWSRPYSASSPSPLCARGVGVVFEITRGGVTLYLCMLRIWLSTRRAKKGIKKITARAHVLAKASSLPVKLCYYIHT
jgi:hypothetical protein